MFFNQDSTCVLKAQLTNAVATSQLEISVNYKDNTDSYHPEKIVATTGTTAVTLLDAPANGVINLVELIKIYNPDSQTNTVQILANSTVIFTCMIGAGQSAVISPEGFNSSGYVAANADLSNLTSAGKAVAANMAMPSNSYIDLTLGASGSTYTAPADGYYYLEKTCGGASLYAILRNTTAANIAVHYAAVSAPDTIFLLLPVKKNDIMSIQYNVTGTTFYFRFIYAQGEV